MNTVNRKIINAIIEKAEKLCPDSLALIGVYGSVATGDDYAKSDLDLLILIEDEEGRKLATGFILDDSKVGYDIYCTDWSSLRREAECHHAHISKLMDSEIVYVKNQTAYEKLCKLRQETKTFLDSDERLQRVDELMTKAKAAYADSLLCDTLGKVRLSAFGVTDCLLNAVMLFHGRYFRLGVKRAFDEIATLPVSDELSDNMRKIAESRDASEIRDLLKELLLCAEKYMHREKQKQEPSEVLTGAYEEMYSNWRNKVEEAANNSDVFSCFANMCCFNYMMSDISAEFDIGECNIMQDYDPGNLSDNVLLYDKHLKEYEKVCNEAGIEIKRYCDVDAFAADYL